MSLKSCAFVIHYPVIVIKDKIININSLCDLKVGDFYRTYFKFYKLTQVVISVFISKQVVKY